MQSSLSAKIIEDKILENYQEYAGLFGELQSDFLSGLYKRYYDLESGHLVLYFVKKAHQSILRKKDFDLSFDLSFDNFWKNHNETKFDPTTIITTSQETNLPKETARRKILELIKQDVLNKKLKTIAWVPSEEYKKNYDQFIATEIIQISKILKFVSHQNNHKISDEEVEIHIKKQFSFFWFHYLNAQLNYIKLCKKKFKDLDVLFISFSNSKLFVAQLSDLKRVVVISFDGFI